MPERTPVEVLADTLGTCTAGCRNIHDRFPHESHCQIARIAAALADLERQLADAQKRVRRSPVPYTRHECDLCQEPLEGRTWEWVDEGWSLACTPCLTKIRGAAERALEEARGALRGASHKEAQDGSV